MKLTMGPRTGQKEKRNAGQTGEHTPKTLFFLAKFADLLFMQYARGIVEEYLSSSLVLQNRL